MNQFIKRGKLKLLFSFLICSFLFNQNAELITQKIDVENAIRDKVSVTLGKLLNQDQFVVIVNARMDVKAFSMDNANRSSSSQSGSYSPIPGLPTVPQNIKAPNGNTFKYSTDKYLLYGLDIAIYLDEGQANAMMQDNIRRLINDTIPEITECEDCIRFETMNMTSSGGSSYQELLQQIEALESDKKDAEQQILNWRFDELARQLSISEDARNDWEAQARERERIRQEEDASRIASLEKIEREYRNKQDSLYLITSIKLDEAVRGRIESSTDLTDKLIDIIKVGMDSNADKDLLGGSIDPDLNRKSKGLSSATLLWIALVIIILLLGAVLLFVSRGKQTVYLKPKSGGTEPAANGNGGESAPPLEPNESTNEASEEPVSFTGTNANENQDVQRSELKSLRQSAVAMSVSHKDGANQIVKDWLDDEGAGSDEDAPTDEAAETEDKS
jgi:hypothetical protein